MNQETLDRIKERIYWGENNSALSTLINDNDDNPEVFVINHIRGKLYEISENVLISQIAQTKGLRFDQIHHKGTIIPYVISWDCTSVEYTLTREPWGGTTVRAIFKFKKL